MQLAELKATAERCRAAAASVVSSTASSSFATSPVGSPAPRNLVKDTHEADPVDRTVRIVAPGSERLRSEPGSERWGDSDKDKTNSHGEEQVLHKSRAHRSLNDIWTGMSLLDEGLAELDQVRRQLNQRRKVKEHHSGLERQRSEQAVFFEAAARTDEAEAKAAEDFHHTVEERQMALGRARAEASEAWRHEAREMTRVLRDLHDKRRERSHDEAEVDLARVRAEALREEATQAADRVAARERALAARRANEAAIAAKQLARRAEAARENADMQRALKEAEEQAAVRQAALSAKAAKLQATLAAMGESAVTASPSSPIFTDQRAAQVEERVARQQAAMEAEARAAAEYRQAHKEAEAAELRQVLHQQVEEHVVSRRVAGAQAKHDLAEVRALAARAREEELERRRRIEAARLEHGRQLRLQMAATVEQACRPDESPTEVRLNRKALIMKKTLFESHVSDILSEMSPAAIHRSGIAERIRQRAARLQEVSTDSELTVAARGILQRIDEASRRFHTTSE